jgi:hypothetical protein
VVERLARSLVIASHTEAQPVSPEQFALDRLSIEGVDVATWAPQTLV